MTTFLENMYDDCMDNAPQAGQAVGYLTGGLAAAPFATAAAAETATPPAWGLGQVETLALGAAAFDFGKEAGTAVGTELSQAGCGITYELGERAVDAFQSVSDYFNSPPPEAAPAPTPDAFHDWASSAAEPAPSAPGWAGTSDAFAPADVGSSAFATPSFEAPSFAAPSFDAGAGAGSDGHAGDASHDGSDGGAF